MHQPFLAASPKYKHIKGGKKSFLEVEALGLVAQLLHLISDKFITFVLVVLSLVKRSKWEIIQLVMGTWHCILSYYSVSGDTFLLLWLGLCNANVCMFFFFHLKQYDHYYGNSGAQTRRAEGAKEAKNKTIWSFFSIQMNTYLPLCPWTLWSTDFSPSILCFSNLLSHSFHLSSLALSHTLIKIPANLADYKRRWKKQWLHSVQTILHTLPLKVRDILSI